MDSAIEREVVVRLYAAAAGEGSWTRVLEAVGEHIAAEAVVLLAQTAGAPESAVLGATGIDAEALRALRECFSVQRLTRTDGTAWRPGGGIRDCDTVYDPRLLLHSENVQDVAIHLAAFRPRHQQPFGRVEHLALAVLAPHLRQAFRVAAQLECANGLRVVLQTLGEQFGKGVAMLDAHWRVLHANAFFERICAADDGLTTRMGVVSTPRINEPAFSRLLTRGMRGETGGRLDLLRPSGGPSYSLVVAPLVSESTVFGAAARASLVVCDPSLVSGPTEATMSLAYGLTRAESRMVARLVGGATVCDTAKHLGISLNTARTHLKRAMAKTGVSRQADLVRLLLTRH
jgi:DNA-binding CsgD family transcriptional regulator